uniref:ARID domain-containing protein n=1 Tax=Timema cristinae TaxID=61476 RepID=A0A7R9D214_TIMCR|nr:unnamed protein product [Timema cristinae]
MQLSCERQGLTVYEVVHKLGGYNRVTNHNQWKTVSHKLGFGMSGSSVINLVKQSYKKFLHSFEDFYRKLGCTMVNHPRGNRSRHRAGRSLIRDRDRSTPINIPKDKDKSANTMAEKRTEFGDRDTQLAESKEFIEDTKKGNLEESTNLTKEENIEVAVDQIKEKEEKVKSKEEKLKLKEQKVKPKEEKMKPKEEKVKPKEEKVKPKEEKLKPKEEKVKPKEEKLKPKEEKLKPKEEKLKPKEEKVKPKEEKLNPKEDKLKLNPKEEKLNPKEEKVKPKEEKVKTKEEKVKPKEEIVMIKEDKVVIKDDKVKPKEDKVVIKDDKMKPKDDKSKVLEVAKKDIEDKEERLRARETKKEDKSKDKELRGRMTELEKVVRIVLEDKGRFAQMSASGCSTPVAQSGKVGLLNKEIKVRKEEKNKFINKEKLEEKQKIKEGDKLTTDEGENPDEIKRKVEKKSEDDEKQTRSKSKDEPRSKKDVTPVDRRTRESRSPGRDFEKKPSPPSLQKTKKLDDDSLVSGCQKKRGRKRKDSEEKPRSEESTGQLSNHVTVLAGDKLKVYYGPTQESKVVYEAKVVEIDMKQKMFLVHYTGWNTRYDEWIKRGRIAENLSWTPSRDRRARQSGSQNKLRKPLQGKRGRPSLSSHSQDGSSRSCSKEPRSTTPSSITSCSSRAKSPATPIARPPSSRITRNTSVESLGLGLEFLRRTRRMSGHTGKGEGCFVELLVYDLPRGTRRDAGKWQTRRLVGLATRRVGLGLVRALCVKMKQPLVPSESKKLLRLASYMSVASYTESEEEEEEEEFETDAETEEADTAVSAQTRSKSEKKDNSSPESSGVTDEKPFRRKLLEEEDDTSLGERRSKRTKKMVAPIVPTSSSSSLSSSPSIKGEEEPVKTEMIEEEELLSEDEQPRGRDFDLNQIRSELKGIERAVNISPEDTLLKHTEDKQEPPVKLITEFKEETVMVTKEEYNIPVVTEQTKEPAAFKNIADASAEDIYEFKEPEPFEFEVRAKRDLSEGRRPIGRIFDEVVPETKVDKSPRKRFGRGKVAIKINSPLEGEMKRRFNRTIGRKIEQATQSGKTVQEIADKPAVTEPTPVPAKPRQLSACEEAFDKLCESPVYHSASKPSPSRCLASDSSAVDISPLSLFSELPGDEEDDCGEDSNDRLVISETEETVAESEGPLFSYPKLFPGLVGSDPPVPKMEETSLDKPPEPPVAESSLFDMTTKLEFETDICKVNVSDECKKEEDDMRGCNSIETSTSMHEDVIKLLLKPGKVVEDYEEDPINAAIQRVIEQSMSDGSNDADIFDENTVMRQPSPVSSSLRQDQTFSPNKEEHSEIDSSVECIKSSPNTELIGDMTVQESAILSPKREPCCLSLRLRLTSECEDVETTEPPSLVKSPQWETYSDNSAVTGTIEKGTLFCFEKIVKQEGSGKASDSYNIESGNDKSDDDEDEEEDEDGSADITLQNPKRRRLDFEPGSTEKIMENNPGNTDPKTIQKEEEPVCEAVKSPSFDPYADLSLKCEELDIPASPLAEGKADLDAEAADNLCSLLCEETIPGSPAPVTEPGQEQETGNKVLEMPFASAVSSNCIPPPATSSTVPVSVGVAVKRGSSEAAPVMDNTPPTTPDSTLSTISDSPRE